jgi:hypothetical protein
MYGEHLQCFASSSFIVLCGIAVFGGCSGTGAKKQPAASKTERPPAYYKVDPGTAAVLKGMVRFTGRKPNRKAIDMGVATLERRPSTQKFNKLESFGLLWLTLRPGISE